MAAAVGLWRGAHTTPSLRLVALTQHPVRFVHPRGYNNYNDCESYIFHEISGALMYSKNIDNFANIFQKFQDQMTDRHIAYAFHFIALNNLPKTKPFWDVILPKVKEQLQTLDYQTTKSLTTIIRGASAMRLQDNELWETIESKLVDERLYRYIELEELT